MRKQSPREKKGTFGEARLSVARKYVIPISRNPLVLLGLLLVALATAWVAANFFLQNASFLSNGPLSSNHATLEGECSACHGAFDEVTSDKCSVCHEKHGDRLGVYTWPAHTIYRSGDFGRVETLEHETECAACHVEHQGRDAAITQVSDGECQSCHPYDSFNEGHPEFDFITEEIPDELGFAFPHIRHVRELMQRQELVDVEKTCLYCHNARGDGKSFAPISFDEHCDTCHLTATERTPPLPVADDQAGQPGVVPLAEIRRGRLPGTQWALFMSDAEFRERGGEITKSPIYHQDPWIEENLRLLRRRMFTDPGLAELLEASAEAPASEVTDLYREAIATLETYAQGLRGRGEPEIRQELEKIEKVLKSLGRSLSDPLTPLDETKFLLALGPPADLPDEEWDALETLVHDLTDVCGQCHLVEDATIARMQQDQRVLRRAEFDHRAHILEMRCLDCHREIPIAEHIEGEGPVDSEMDNAAIQNLPGIESCRECHTPRLASNRCVTCHFFHPNKSRRSEMLLYLDGEDVDSESVDGGNVDGGNEGGS